MLKSSRTDILQKYVLEHLLGLVGVLLGSKADGILAALPASRLTQPGGRSPWREMFLGEKEDISVDQAGDSV